MIDFGAYRTIRATRRGRILTLTLDRPEKLNAVDALMHAELSRIFVDAADDPGSDVVVLTGAGRAFCAGGDIDWMQTMIDEGFGQTRREAARIVTTLLDCEKPVLAAVNGHATGLGATIALFCDLVFMADSARIGDPHVSIGLTAGDGGAIIWPHLLGHARAKQFLLTGDLLTAADAERLGLVNQVCPLVELESRVGAFADRLAAGAQLAIRTTKRAVNLSLKAAVIQGLDASLALEEEASRHVDHREAVAAFREGRTRS